MHPGLRCVLTRLVEGSAKRPWAPLLGASLIGILATLVATQLEFRGNFFELLPENSPEVQDLRFVEKKAGAGDYFMVQVTGGTQTARRAFADEFTTRFEQERDVVRYVERGFNMPFLRNRALLLLPPQKLAALRDDIRARIQYEKALANPLYIDLGISEAPLEFAQIQKKYFGDIRTNEYRESADGHELYIYVKPTQLAGDLSFNRKLITRAEAVSQEVLIHFPTLQTQFTGAHVIRIEEDELIHKDLARAAFFAFLASFGIILLASRRFVTLPIVALPLFVGITCTFAFTKVLLGHLNPITGFLCAVLIGLGIEYGVHLSMRYREERERHSPQEAVLIAVLSTFKGAMASASINSAAFAVLLFAQFAAFRQFGIVAAFGVMSTMCATYLVGPAILLLSERLPHIRRATHNKSSVRPVLQGRSISSTSLISIMVLFIAAAVYSASMTSHVGFETNLRKLKGKSPATDLSDHITKQLDALMTPAIAWVPDAAAAQVAAKTVREMQARQRDTGSITHVLSINDLVPWDAEKRLPIIAEIKRLVEDLPKTGEVHEKIQWLLQQSQVKPWGIDDLPKEIRRSFDARKNQGTFLFIFPRHAGYDVNVLRTWAADLEEIIHNIQAQGIEIHILDGNRIAGRILNLVHNDGPPILLLAAAIVFVMIWLSLRNLRSTVLVACPLYLGMTCVVGAMHYFGVQLNIFNVVILPNLLAIAVDNSVHLYHRYNDSGPGSIGHVMRHTGFAAIIATLSNAAGYGALLLANHEGLRSVGVMAVLGVACTFVGTTIFFPALLTMLERWGMSQARISH